MNLFITLYLINFIRTIIFILIVYFAIKLFTRYILPLILENRIRKMQERMNNRNNWQDRSNKSEGEVTIEYGSQKNNNTRRKDEGEYVDFEEVE